MEPSKKDPYVELMVENVVVKKIGDRVTVKGAYTKRGLRNLLLSTASLPVVDGEVDEDQQDEDEKDKYGKDKYGKDKYGRGKGDDEKSKREKRLEKARKRRKLKKEKTGKTLEKSIQEEDAEDLEDSEFDSKTTIDPREEMLEFLLNKSLSQSLINTLFAVGLTDEFIRLLKAMGWTDEEIEKLRRLFQMQQEDSEASEDSCASLPSSSDEYLSQDSIFLKNIVRKPLRDALRDIVSKKPFDPIEYLGHWLLHYKVCEERDKKRRECELELFIEREKLRLKAAEDEVSVMSLKRGGEDESVDDENYLNYGG